MTQAQATLTGKITDKATGEAIIGANIYIADLKTGAVSDINGMYKIETASANQHIGSGKLCRL